MIDDTADGVHRSGAAIIVVRTQWSMPAASIAVLGGTHHQSLGDQPQWIGERSSGRHSLEVRT